MTVGEKIKIARAVRGLTQKELGFLVGLADVRIRQYETNIRTPKESQLKLFSSALGVPVEFFLTHNIETNLEILHMLFELEDTRGISIIKIDDSNKLTQKYALVFENTDINNHLENWYRKQIELKSSENKSDIDKYRSWKTTYPAEYLKESEERLSKAKERIENKNATSHQEKSQ